MVKPFCTNLKYDPLRVTPRRDQRAILTQRVLLSQNQLALWRNPLSHQSVAQPVPVSSGTAFGRPLSWRTFACKQTRRVRPTPNSRWSNTRGFVGVGEIWL